MPSPFATPGTSTYSTVASVDFFGSKIRDEPGNPRVGHARDAHARLGAAPGGGRRRPGEELEERALADEGEAEDARLHGRDYRSASARGRGRGERVLESGPGDAARPARSRAPGGPLKARAGAGRTGSRRRPRHPLPHRQLGLAAAARPGREAGRRPREDVHVPQGAALPPRPLRRPQRGLRRRRLEVPQRRAVDGLLPRVREGEGDRVLVPRRHRDAHGASHRRDPRPRPRRLARASSRLGRPRPVRPPLDRARRRDADPALRRPRRRAAAGTRAAATPSSRPASSSTW